jgi:hypothetical protein
MKNVCFDCLQVELPSYPASVSDLVAAQCSGTPWHACVARLAVGPGGGSWWGGHDTGTPPVFLVRLGGA